MQNVKIIIVDDESRARSMLSSLLEEFVEGIEIVGTANSVEEAISVIKKVKPELVFLDIQMPGGNGFTLFDHFENPKFEVIFTTAYDQYAIEAIKKSALDYIMKPIGVEELIDAIEKFKTKRKNKTDEPEESFVFLDYEDAGKQNLKIAISNIKGFELIKLKAILYCSASSNYCEFHLTNGKVFLASSTLKFFEEKISPYGFLRVHDSYLVNLSKINKYIRGRGGQLELVDGTLLPVSRSRKDNLLEIFNS